MVSQELNSSDLWQRPLRGDGNIYFDHTGPVIGIKFGKLTFKTADSTSVFTVLEKGLDDLMDLCDTVSEKFTVSRDSFEQSKMQ